MRRSAPRPLLALALLAVCACGRPSADANPPEITPRPETNPAAASGAPTAPAAAPRPSPEKPPVKSSAREVTLAARLAIEHNDGSGYTPHMPAGPTLPVKAGDRLHVAADLPDGVHTYAVGARKQAHFRRLGAWAPGEVKGDRLWPDGLVLDGPQADIDSLFIVVSSIPLDWLASLDTAECGDLVGQMPPDPPKTQCDHLYGLYWKVAGSPRGRMRPKLEPIEMADGRNAMAIVARTRPGNPLSAVQFQLRSRP